MVAFIGVALVCFGKQVLHFGRSITFSQGVCYQIYQDESAKCVDAPGGFQPCADKASAAMKECSLATRTTMTTRLGEYLIEAALSLLAGYGALLFIRTLGWIFEGFKREPQK